MFVSSLRLHLDPSSQFSFGAHILSTSWQFLSFRFLNRWSALFFFPVLVSSEIASPSSLREFFAFPKTIMTLMIKPAREASMSESSLKSFGEALNSIPNVQLFRLQRGQLTLANELNVLVEKMNESKMKKTTQSTIDRFFVKEYTNHWTTVQHFREKRHFAKISPY